MGRNQKLHEITFFLGMYCEPTEMDYRIFQMNSYLPKSPSETKGTLSVLTQSHSHGHFWWKKTILVVVCWCISPFKFPHLSARCDSSANSTDTSILTESTLNPSSLFAYFISPALQKKALKAHLLQNLLFFDTNQLIPNLLAYTAVHIDEPINLCFQISK